MMSRELKKGMGIGLVLGLGINFGVSQIPILKSYSVIIIIILAGYLLLSKK